MWATPARKHLGVGWGVCSGIMVSIYNHGRISRRKNRVNDVSQKDENIYAKLELKECRTYQVTN